MTFGDRLKELRKENNLLQSDIAKLLKTTPQAVGLYENEKRDIPTKVLIQLAKYFNCSIDYLMGKSSYRNGHEYLNSLRPCSGYDLLNDLGKQKAIEYIKDLTEIPKYAIKKTELSKEKTI